jgi:peptidoglycan glycosyltransferase
MDRRIRIVGAGVLILFLVLFLQLNNLQVLQASRLSNAPGNPRNTIVRFEQTRGSILTSDGVVIANSVPSTTPGDPYKYLRQYPHGPLYADITGYFSLIYGETGVEAAYDKYLVSHTAPLRNLSDLLINRTTTNDVTLTINSRLQQEAASALGNLSGSVVALDPQTGAILAMYSAPTFDPNKLASHNTNAVTAAWKAYQADPTQPMLARAYRRAYPPGSTFKIITSTAVYDHDPALATKNYPVESAISLPQATQQLHNFDNEACGGMLPELLKVSCDTGFAQVGLDLGASALSATANAFGFNQAPPLDLSPGAAASTFPAAKSFQYNLPGLAFSAIGQEDVSATPLQMALAAAGIANHGVIMAPHVMAQIRDQQGNVVQTYHPHAWLTATTQQTASTVTQLMVGVTEGGTATNVAIPGVQVAAKTGTAETGGASGATANWLVAFAPAQHPTIAVAVVVPPQAGLPASPTGSEVAGPIARAMLVAALGSS